jgi:protein-serine/threonine kinase
VHPNTLGNTSQFADQAPAISSSHVSQPQKKQEAQHTSPRHLATELSDPIPEEACESESELAEPVTPVSHHSQQFQTHEDQQTQDIPAEPLAASTPAKNGLAPAQSHTRAAATPSPSKPADQETPATLSRRSTFTRAVSSLFKRSGSQLSQQGQSSSTAEVNGDMTNSATPTSNSNAPSNTGRRWSQNPSSNTTRSNSPPSPGSPLEMAKTANHQSTGLPEPADFKDPKKGRAATGLSFRGRGIKFVGRDGAPRTRRAASFDAGRPDPHHHRHHHHEATPESYWPHLPDAGTGTKARRISISLPDDFTVDVGELMRDFEYQSKLLGRHGRHLGKGAASKVTLMARKGFPSELYAVKEFRAKSKSETKDEYEKKIKSEYSIAKSLHHPNIVETISLCTDHGRWNHVMEYCSEGDLFSLAKKKYLMHEDRITDRHCLFKQLIQGIHYLHSHGIAHRDIKLENLLVTKDSKLKITDFGVSEVFCGTHPGLREAGGQCGINMSHETRLCDPGICGSMPYIAPEVLAKKEKYDPRGLDVWGAAVVMITFVFSAPIWEKAVSGQPCYDNLVNGWERWNSAHEGKAEEEIDDDDYPFAVPFNKIKPAALRKLLIKMLNPDPTKRLSIADVYNNRWIRMIECCQPESNEDQNKGIDATKSASGKKIRCHNHLPGKNMDTSLIGNSNFD